MKVKATVIIESNDWLVQDLLNGGFSREEIIKKLERELYSQIGREGHLVSDVDDIEVEELK